MSRGRIGLSQGVDKGVMWKDKGVTGSDKGGTDLEDGVGGGRDVVSAVALAKRVERIRLVQKYPRAQ